MGGLTFWLFCLGQYVNNQWGCLLVSVHPWPPDVLFSWGPDHAGLSFHMHLLLQLWLCPKIMRPARAECSAESSGFFSDQQFLGLASGIFIKFYFQTLTASCLFRVLGCLCWGMRFLWRMVPSCVVLRLFLKGSVGQTPTCICPLIKG